MRIPPAISFIVPGMVGLKPILAVERRHKCSLSDDAVSAAGKALIAEMARNGYANPEPSAETSTKLDDLRRSRRNERRELYAEILQLRASGLSPRQIAPRIGMNVRTIQRWLAAGGEPEHRRPPTHSVVMNPFRAFLEKRLREGQRSGAQLWHEIKRCGFQGGRATVYRWIAVCLDSPSSIAPSNARWRPPSGRNCAWLLSEDPTSCADRAVPSSSP